MKKIFTFLLAAGSFTIASAQTRDHKAQDNYTVTHTTTVVTKNSDARFDGHGSNVTAGKEAQIQKINREYDLKINAVLRDRHMRAAEKNRQVKSLERQKTQAIQQVNDYYARARYDNKHDTRKW